MYVGGVYKGRLDWWGCGFVVGCNVLGKVLVVWRVFCGCGYKVVLGSWGGLGLVGVVVCGCGYD